MKWLVPVLLALPLSAFAETNTYEVSGMTCNSCVKALKAQVCKLDGIEKCDITIGKMVLSSKAGTPLNETKIKEAVAHAGDYKVIDKAPKK